MCSEPISESPETADSTPDRGMIPDYAGRSIIGIISQYRAAFREILDGMDEAGADATSALLSRLDRATERALIQAVHIGHYSEGATRDDFEAPDRATICTTVEGDTADRWRQLRKDFDGFTTGEILTAMIEVYTGWVQHRKTVIG